MWIKIKVVLETFSLEENEEMVLCSHWVFNDNRIPKLFKLH